MDTVATVISVVGQAWAQAADGARRELRAGDRLRGDETLITAPGARVDLDFGDNRILSFTGEQTVTTDEAAATVAAVRPAVPPAQVQAQPEAAQSGERAAGPVVPEGHNFVQLVRIAEIIEADGITPLTVARIRELLRPLDMGLPDRVPEADDWREHRGGDRHESGPAARKPGLSVELEGAGADGIYNAAEIGPDGTVTARIALDDKVRAGDRLVVKDGAGHVLLDRPVTPEDLLHGVAVEVPVAPGQPQVVVEATVTTPAGFTGSDGDDKPVDNVPPAMTPIGDFDADPVDLDLSRHFSDDTPLTYAATGLPPGLNIDPHTGAVTGTLDRSASQGGSGGQYPVTVTATDAAGNSTTQTFTWTVANPSPVAANDSATTAEDTPVSGNVLGNDDDPDGDALTVTGFEIGGTSYGPGATATIPGVGTLVIHPDGGYTFTPAPDWNGTVPTATYTISDGEGGTASAELTIVVTPVNDAPVALPPSGPLDQTDADADTIATVTLDLPNLFGDVDGDTLTYTIAGLPPGLNFDPLTGEITGTLDHSASQGGPGGDGVYSVTLTATDPDGATATQTFTWTVTNPPPVANPDSGSITEDGPDLVVNAANGVLHSGGAPGGVDSDPDGDDISVTHVIAGTAAGSGDFSGPANAGTTITGSYGQLTLHADGSYTYALDNANLDVQGLTNGETLADVFSYAISDGDGGTAWTTLTIAIDGADDGVTVSVPADHGATTPDGNTADQVVFESGLSSGSGPDADDTVVEASFTLSALDGLATNGAVAIGYTDAGGNPATLTLSRAQVEALGSASQTITTRYGTLELHGYSLDGDGVITLDYTYTLTTAPAVSGTGADDVFAITATDRDGDGNAAQNLTIRIVDDAPQAVDDVNTIAEGDVSVTGALIAGTAGAGEDTEGADGATVSKIVAGTDNTLPGSAPDVAGIPVAGQYGTLTIHADGSYSYALDNANLAVQGLNEGETLQEVFTYTLTDGDGDESVATLTITITDSNDEVIVTVPTDHAANTPTGNITDQVVFESGLASGSSPSPNDTVVDASFTISALDGLADADAVTIAYTDVDGDPATLELSRAQVEALGSANQIITTEYGTLVLNGYGRAASGVITVDYTYTLTSAPAVSGVDTSDVFTITATDRDGDSNAAQSLTIRIVDDAPTANNDTDSVAAGQYSAETGNVITGAGTTNAGGSGIDVHGADGASVTGVASNNVPGNTASDAGGTLTIQGQYGTLVIEPDGDYSYTRAANTPGGVNDVFTYTLTDGDDDSVTATLTIGIVSGTPGISGLTPQASGGELTVEEKHLADGNAPDSAALTKSGDFTISSPDGVKALTVGGVTVIADGALTGTLTVTTSLGNTLTITGYDPATGVVEYSYTLGDNETHTRPANDTALFESIALVLTDHDDQTANGTLSVRIVDDIPVVTADASQLGGVTVDESTLGTPATDSDFIAGVFGVDYGADGAAASNPLVYALDVASTGVAAGVTDTASGQGIYLYKAGNDIVGRVGSGGAANPAGAEAFRIAIDASTGAVTLTQSRALRHPDADDADDPLSLTPGAVTLTATATDGDGDPVASAPVNVGGRFTFLDDGPRVTAATGVTIDEAHLALGSAPDVPQTTKGSSLNVAFGADGGGDVGDVLFTSATIDALAAQGLASNGTALTYAIANDGHTLTAWRGPVVNNIPVFTVDIANPTTAPAYQFTLIRPLDHVDADGQQVASIGVGFAGIRVTDRDGDAVTTNFTVTVLDDTPDEAQPQQVTVVEDSVLATPANTFNTNADATGSNTTIGDGNNGTTAPAHGTAMVNANGTITYVPTGNYSGTDTFTYTTVTETETKTFTVVVTVDPVADAPGLPHAGSGAGHVAGASVATPEDTDVALGLKVPVISDDTDQNGSGTAGDHGERLGAIALTLSGAGATAGAVLAKADGTALVASGGIYTIVIVTGGTTPDADLHVGSGLPAANVNYLTAAEYESLIARPAAHRHENFQVGVSVTSYEVDDSGVPRVGVAGATATQSITVYVEAVTDDAALVFDTAVTTGTNIDAVSYGGTGGNTEATVTLKEDTTFNVKSILGTAFQDLDGSEVRSITITNNTGQAILVNGATLASGASTTVNALAGGAGQTGTINSFPNITIGAAGDYSGDLDGIGIRINAQDRDADGYDSGNVGTTVDGVAEAVTTNNGVTLNLRVTPAAGDVAAADVTTAEDTAVAFLAGVRVTDTGTGSEVITRVEFTVPTAGNGGGSTWVVTAPDLAPSLADDGYEIAGSGTGGTYTITFNDDGGAGVVLSGVQREAVLDGFTIRPPAHSSLDASISLSITTADTQTVGGSPVTGTATVTRPVAITVTPVAERENVDSAGPAGNDVSHGGSHIYSTLGEEDVWFTLGQENGFNLETGWANEDGDEQTYAVLTPTLIPGSGDALAEAKGSQFRYSTNGITTEAGGAWTTLIYDGSIPVAIPMAYLDTLQFRAAKNFSGKFEIDVRVRTVDYDDDGEGSGTPATYTSDVVATLKNILILPAADQVTLAVHGLAKGDEDTRIPLKIEPRSDDPSETYTVVIRNIPAGARLFYGNDPDTALELTVTGGATTIDNFNSNTLLTVLPPVDSNADFALTVEANSVDTMPNLDDPGNPYVRVSPIETKIIQVQIRGVADGFDLQTEPNKTYTEGAVDGAMNHLVPLRELITGHVPRDTDGSEALNLKITLPAGFALVGGTWLGDGWLLDESQLATASIRVPEHFSGQVAVGVTVISTESDGHSTGVPGTVTFTITPEVEKAMHASSGLAEDTRGQMQFALPGGGDTKETLTSVWVDAADVAAGSGNYTLYYGATGNQTLADAASDPGITGVVLEDGWYKLSGSAIGNIYAQGAANSHGSYGFGVEYTVVNTASNGPATDTRTVTGATHTLSIAAVTDPATLVITNITSSNAGNADITIGDDTNDAEVEVTGNTILTIDFRLTKDPDADAGGARDHDGSERLTGLVIDGVPQGVTIVGADYIGNVPGGAGSENTGRWLLPIDRPINANGATFSIEFELLASAEILAGLNDSLTVTAITQDDGGAEVNAAASWMLKTPAAADDFDDTDISGIAPVVIDDWSVDYATAPGLEDEEFRLGDVVRGALADTGPFAITITGFSGGTIAGMSDTIVNGVPTWTLYGSGDSDDLQALLNAITIAPPGDRNSNGSAPWSFDVTLTTYAPNGERNVETRVVAPPLAPVTDPAAVTVTTSSVAEGDAVNFTVSVAPGVDGAFSQVVDGRLYLQLSVGGNLAAGTLTGPAGALVAQAVTGVAGVPDGNYYVIEGVDFGDEIALTYQGGGAHASGTVSLTAGFLTHEANADAADIRYGSGGATAAVAPRNSGINFTDEHGAPITALTAAGAEDQRVELRLGSALHDQDGSERLAAAFLRAVPASFLVVVGSDAGSARLAGNAGDGVWVLPLTDGELPAYIAVLPPRNWSGTATGLELVLQAGEQALAIEDFVLPVTLEVAPVADGISIAPTLTFGAEGDIIPINLNAAVPDNDGSELVTLTFTGLGAHAAFYAGATLLAGVGYDPLGDVYTLSGLTPQQINDLGFRQAAGVIAGPVAVSARTVDGGDESATVDGSFAVNITPQLATNGNEFWLYNDRPIDGRGGDDTIQLRFGESRSGTELAANLSNIETIDLGTAGENRITSLGIDDVLTMTESRAGTHTLKILGDAADHVAVDAAWGTGVLDGGYTVYVASHGAETVRLEIASGIHID